MNLLYTLCVYSALNGLVCQPAKLETIEQCKIDGATEVAKDPRDHERGFRCVENADNR